MRPSPASVTYIRHLICGAYRVSRSVRALTGARGCFQRSSQSTSECGGYTFIPIYSSHVYNLVAGDTLPATAGSQNSRSLLMPRPWTSTVTRARTTPYVTLIPARSIPAAPSWSGRSHHPTCVRCGVIQTCVRCGVTPVRLQQPCHPRHLRQLQ